MNLNKLLLISLLILTTTLNANTSYRTFLPDAPIKTRTKPLLNWKNKKVVFFPVRLNEISKSLLLFQLESNTSKNAYIVVNSMGGSVRSLIHLIAYIAKRQQKSTYNVNCLVTREAASAAAMFLSICNYVYMHKDATLFYHSPYTTIQIFQFESEEQIVEMAKGMYNAYQNLLAGFAQIYGVTPEAVRLFMKDDTTLGAEEANRMNLTDFIILDYNLPTQGAN